MPWPEPSTSDHDAPWNIDLEENEDGEEVWVCSCTSCLAKRSKNVRDEARCDEWEDSRYGRRI